MGRVSPKPAGGERALLDAAQEGDEDAFRRLVEPHRRELHAHCYRMLGSVHDADDALQDALLRAWRGLPRFDGRSPARPWLYKIATNTSLDTIARRSKRALPLEQLSVRRPARRLRRAARGVGLDRALHGRAAARGPCRAGRALRTARER